MKYDSNNRSLIMLKYISAVFFIVYLLFLIYLTFFAQRYGRGFIHRSINLTPFKTVMLYLNSPYNSRNNTIMNIAGNIVAFMPMGFLLPLAAEKLKNFMKVLLFVLLATIAIETLQYVIGVGVSDIDDVILNTLGGVIGYLFYKIFIWMFPNFRG